MQIYSEYIFPRLFNSVLKHQGFESTRREILRSVRGRILEIGIGTGLNLDFYPLWVKHISAIEPNPGMREQLWEKSNGHRIQVNCQQAGAESLPFADAAFDSVVSTFTMCSLVDPQEALREIRRVLAPGGHFIFMEHGLSRNPEVARTQRFLNPLQRIVGCGCSLTVDVAAELRLADFGLDKIEIHCVGTGPKFLGNIYEGVAFPATAKLS